MRDRLSFYRQRYSPSQIVALDDEPFAAGIARIGADLAAAGDAPVMSVSHACLVTICAANA